MTTISGSGQPRRTRLEKLDIQPFVRAQVLQPLQLYWLGVENWPPTFQRRNWILAFVDEFSTAIEKQFSTQPMQFVQMNVLNGALRQLFLKEALSVSPVMGYSIRPGRPGRIAPTEDEIKQMQERKKPVDMSPYHGNYCYWFLRGNHAEQRRLFLAFGGMTVLYSKPDDDAKIQMPEIPKVIYRDPAMKKLLGIFDLKSELHTLEMMKSSFRETSKQLFGKAFVDRPEYKGIPFVLPTWTSEDFFNRPPVELDQLFEVCQVYMRESMEDNGLLLASKENIEPLLTAVIEKLRGQGLEYVD